MSENNKRFTARGEDVLDSERPALVCGFMTLETAQWTADLFNNEPDAYKDFVWVKEGTDEIVDVPDFLDDYFPGDDDNEDEEDK